MTVGERLKHNDIDTYYKLLNMCRGKIDKPRKKVELGDSIENLMSNRSYKRIGGRMRQMR